MRRAERWICGWNDRKGLSGRAFWVLVLESAPVKSKYAPKACASCYQGSRDEPNSLQFHNLCHTHCQGDWKDDKGSSKWEVDQKYQASVRKWARVACKVLGGPSPTSQRSLWTSVKQIPDASVGFLLPAAQLLPLRGLLLWFPFIQPWSCGLLFNDHIFSNSLHF